MAKKSELTDKVSADKKAEEKKPATKKIAKAKVTAEAMEKTEKKSKNLQILLETRDELMERASKDIIREPKPAPKKAVKKKNRKRNSPSSKKTTVPANNIEKGKLFIHPALPTGHQDSADCFKKMSDTLNTIHSTVIDKQEDAAVFAEKVFGEEGVVAEFSGYRQIIKDEAQLVTYESTVKEIIKSGYQKISAFYDEPVPAIQIEVKEAEVVEEFKLPEAAKLGNQVDPQTALKLMSYARDFVTNSVINSLEDKELFEREVLGENGYIAQAIAYKPLFETTTATTEEKEMYATLYNDLVVQAKRLSEWRAIGAATDGGAAKAVNEAAVAATVVVKPAPVNKTLAEILDEKLAGTLAVLKNHQAVRNLHVGQLKDFLATNSGQGYLYTYNEAEQKICLSFGNETAESEFKI
jgi:hypothetical protein